MKKIDAILNVYGLNAIKNDLSVNFRNEEICAWAIENATKKWNMPMWNWNLTLSQLAIFFEGRLDSELKI